MHYIELFNGSYFKRILPQRFAPQGVMFIKAPMPRMSQITSGKYAKWNASRKSWDYVNEKPILEGRLIYTPKMSKKQFLSLFSKSQRKLLRDKMTGSNGQTQDEDLLQAWETITESGNVNLQDKLVKQSLKQLKASGVIKGRELAQLRLGYPYKRVL